MSDKKWFEKYPVISGFVLAGFVFCTSFILIEFVLRGAEYYQYIKPSNRILFKSYRQIYSDERNKEYVFGHYPNKNVLLINGENKYTFITNSEGLREKKDYENLDRSVIFLGDSIIEGVSVENEEAVDEVFEAKTGIVSLNFGMGSSNTVQEYYWLKNKYKSGYNTKLIVLGFCLNDLFQNTYLRRFDPVRSNWSLYKYLDNKSLAAKQKVKPKLKQFLRKSKTISFLYRVYTILRQKRAEASDIPPDRYDEVSQGNKEYTELYLLKIKEFAESIGAEFVVVIFPREKQLRARYDEANRRIQYALIEILERNNIEYIDLYDVMKENYIANPDIRWYHDDTHPYKAGHKLVGEYLSDKLPHLFPEVFQ